MVTGGYNESIRVPSTEILTSEASQWVYAGELPTGRWGATGVTLGNKLLLAGEIIGSTAQELYLIYISTSAID